MSSLALVLDENGTMLCPFCEHVNTHVDAVVTSTRREEDGPVREMFVDANGDTGDLYGAPGPMGTCVGEGRRHRFALVGSCEDCGRIFAVVFTQHKGNTIVEIVDGGHRWSRVLG